MAKKTLTTRKKRVLDTVFKQPQISLPTPVVTPATGFSVHGQAFGVLPLLDQRAQYEPRGTEALSSTGLYQSAPDNEAGHAQHQTRWDRSWHTVTYDLALSDIPTHLNPMELSDSEDILGLLRYSPTCFDAEFEQALLDVLDPQSRLPKASYHEDIMSWHTEQVQNHFLQQVLPVISRITNESGPEMYLFRVIRVLDASHRLYVLGLDKIIGTSRSEIDSFKTASHLPSLCRDLHAIVSNSITSKLVDPLRDVLREKINAVLGLPSGPDASHLLQEDTTSEVSRQLLLALLQKLQDVGLSGESLQTILAEVMHESMTLYVHVGYKRVWSIQESRYPTHQQHPSQRRSSILPRTAHHASPSRCVMNLCEWIENRYAKLAVQVFSILKLDTVEISWLLVEKWKEMGIARLASLRTNELFDIVANWPNSSGALEDLKTAITTPQRRLHLTEVFAVALDKRLLHPGTSTLQILQYYISMISSFHALDHSKVLLDRVAHPLQVYLYSREDTVRVIIAGLLSDTEDANGDPIGPGGDRLHQLAFLLNNNGEDQQGQNPSSFDDDLDWHDMDWMPDPVDAGPGYKRSKSADIIGTLIRALGTQEVFIKEFQNIIGENLLRQDGAFDREIKVLELLKARFGEAPLQSCEVMLKDIQDSVRVNSNIRRSQQLDPSGEELIAAQRTRKDSEQGSVDPEGLLRPSLHAKILSRLFWPQLHDETYRIPEEILQLQKLYEIGFESLKSSRKLTWLHALGQATVELDLTDRTIVEEVHTWQATVIWAFQSDGEGEVSIRRSVTELVEHLEMDEALVRNALKFWTNKIVLQEVEKDVFSVLETLNQEDRARSNAQAAASATATADDGTDDDSSMANNGVSKEKRQLYWQFIQGMLKNNSSQMPLQQIGMMLKMLLPDGFPLSNEELQEFLGSFVVDGALVFAGGKYKLKR